MSEKCPADAMWNVEKWGWPMIWGTHTVGEDLLVASERVETLVLQSTMKICSSPANVLKRANLHCTLKYESFPRILVFSWRFSFFCVIFLSTSLRSLCSNVIQDLRPPRLVSRLYCFIPARGIGLSWKYSRFKWYALTLLSYPGGGGWGFDFWFSQKSQTKSLVFSHHMCFQESWG